MDTTNLPASAANWFNPWGSRQPQRTWTQGGIQLVPGTATGTTLTAAAGGYALTGSDIVWRFVMPLGAAGE